MIHTNHSKTRREFLQQSTLAATSLAMWNCRSEAAAPSAERLPLSIHQYSLKKLFDAGTLKLSDYASFVKKTFGITNVEFGAEFCNQLLAEPKTADLIRQRSKQIGVTHQTLLCAAGNPLDATSKVQRAEAVKVHVRWAQVAEALGCRFMRVRASEKGDRAQQMKNAAAGISALCDALKGSTVSVLIENITGFSRDADWLVDVVKLVGPERVGLIADFGNFEGDIYAGMKKLLPYSKSICTKSWEFDDAGNETKIDFKKMMGLIKASKFAGCVAIEYLGDDPVSGVRKTAELVRRHA